MFEGRMHSQFISLTGTKCKSKNLRTSTLHFQISSKSRKKQAMWGPPQKFLNLLHRTCSGYRYREIWACVYLCHQITCIWLFYLESTVWASKNKNIIVTVKVIQVVHPCCRGAFKRENIGLRWISRDKTAPFFPSWTLFWATKPG